MGREREVHPPKGAPMPETLDMGTPAVALTSPTVAGSIYGGKPKPSMPPPPPPVATTTAQPAANVTVVASMKPDCERLEEGLLMGKLMETEMTLRLKFENGKELRRVQDKVRKALDFLEELHSIATQLDVIEGLLFQELIARLNSMSPATFSTATTPASPTLRAIRQENRALGGMGSPPAMCPVVNRTPLPGQAHPHPSAQQNPEPTRPMQAKVEAMGYEKQQNLIRNVANLRGLVRIKIEDNGDLALAKKALIDARLVFDNVWALAFELPVEAVDGTAAEETSWPPSPGEDPSLDGRVTLVLEKLRRID